MPLFLFIHLQKQNLFIMKHLTLFNAIFVLLLVGKIGNIGDLGEIGWLLVVLPLFLNNFVNLIYYVAEVKGFKGFIANYLELRKLKQIQKNYPDILEKAKADYWNQLKAESNENAN